MTYKELTLTILIFLCIQWPFWGCKIPNLYGTDAELLALGMQISLFIFSHSHIHYFRLHILYTADRPWCEAAPCPDSGWNTLDSAAKAPTMDLTNCTTASWTKLVFQWHVACQSSQESKVCVGMIWPPTIRSVVWLSGIPCDMCHGTFME